MADIDAAFVQQIFHIAKGQREPNIQHHSQANDLGASFEIPKRGAFCHSARLRNHPARLKAVFSDKTHLTNDMLASDGGFDCAEFEKLGGGDKFCKDRR